MSVKDPNKPPVIQNIQGNQNFNTTVGGTMGMGGNWPDGVSVAMYAVVPADGIYPQPIYPQTFPGNKLTVGLTEVDIRRIVKEMLVQDDQAKRLARIEEKLDRLLSSPVVVELPNSPKEEVVNLFDLPREEFLKFLDAAGKPGSQEGGTEINREDLPKGVVDLFNVPKKDFLQFVDAYNKAKTNKVKEKKTPRKTK